MSRFWENKPNLEKGLLRCQVILKMPAKKDIHINSMSNVEACVNPKYLDPAEATKLLYANPSLHKAITSAVVRFTL